MADNDRWRDDPERYRGRDEDRGFYRGGPGYERDHGSDEGFIAQRGFGNARSGYDRSRSRSSEAYPRHDRDRHAGYGQGSYGQGSYGRSSEGDPQRTYGAEAYGRPSDEYARGGYRADRDHGRRGSAYGHEDRYSSRAGPGREDDRDPHGPPEDVWGYRGERSGWDRFSDEVSSWFGDDEAARRRAQDARSGDSGAQHHRGRGPKGYQRSDQRILEDVNDRLTDDPYLDASEIDVTVSNREVTLKGNVTRREDKRRAEDIVESVPGVTHVQNNLRVQAPGMTVGTASATSFASATGSTDAGAGDVEVTRTETGTGRRTGTAS